MIDSKTLKRLYLEFFTRRGHKIIPNASLIPENDPTVLFTTAGMHPLVPFLLGQPYALGKRLVNFQRCLRTDDIDCISDISHLTFFEMLGNWSLGDYFKEDSINWSFEFLTDEKWLNLDKNRIFVTVFAGDEDAPRDEESANIWRTLGIPDERIFYLPKKDNWWGPAGETGPCGPDTEIFYDTGLPLCGPECRPGCSCSKYFEIWNNVFMQYNKMADGKYELLKQKNVDTGMGVERTVASLQRRKSVFEIETIKPTFDQILELAHIQKPDEKQEASIRIITDHIRASTFLLGDERSVLPSNVDQGYILRRLIRRGIRHGKVLGIEKEFLSVLAENVISIYADDYPQLKNKKEFIINELKKEDLKFRNTLSKGLRKFVEFTKNTKIIDSKASFLLFQSYGFPIEMTKELADETGVEVDLEGFWREYEKHQQTSRTGSQKRFKGGLSDATQKTTKLHTTTHLLNEALRRVLNNRAIEQKGSNITPERIRFDFNFDRKLTEEELREVEALVNEQIKQGLKVTREEMTIEEAKKKGVQAVFDGRYSERVFVYSIGDFSKEVCGGPHVTNTMELGTFKIVKEEGIAAGIRRIRAILI